MDENVSRPTTRARRSERPASRTRRVRRGLVHRCFKRCFDKAALLLRDSLPLARAVKKFLQEWVEALRPLRWLRWPVIAFLARAISHFF